MYVIVGLGNPGKEYEQTRHNAGFRFVDNFSEFLGWDHFYDVKDWEKETSQQYYYREVVSEGVVRMLLVKPLTFMNRSGIAVDRIAKKMKVGIANDLILAHDDLDVPLGSYKIQNGVAPKEHRGVKSVEMILGRNEFLRVRLGIDARGGDRSISGEEYVLGKMAQDEITRLDEAIAKAAQELRTMLNV